MVAINVRCSRQAVQGSLSNGGAQSSWGSCERAASPSSVSPYGRIVDEQRERIGPVSRPGATERLQLANSDGTPSSLPCITLAAPSVAARGQVGQQQQNDAGTQRREQEEGSSLDLPGRKSVANRALKSRGKQGSLIRTLVVTGDVVDHPERKARFENPRGWAHQVTTIFGGGWEHHRTRPRGLASASQPLTKPWLQ
ncbi:hypothetical protein L209DRAFT_600716 [Thermothelomyces heterothallicus CBS 203.75]